MIVCSLPRCGATKFCLDLEARTKLQFVGELNPIHINNDRKAVVHETLYQPAHTPSSFADILNNNDDCIALVNQHSYLMLPHASFVILRRNMRNAALSLANFLIKMYPSIKPIQINHQLTLMYHDWIGIRSYLDKYPKDTIWYEDYYNIFETKTPLLDQYRGRDLIMKEIEALWDTHLIDVTH